MRTLSLCLALLLVGLGAWADAAKQFQYHGRIASDGKTFTGAGAFKFALLDGNGNYLWTSGAIPVMAGIPTGVVMVPVAQGAYAVVLGNAALGMPAMPAALLARTEPCFLRIWFDDGTHGMARVGLDQPIAPTIVTTPTAAGDRMEQMLAEPRQIRLLLEQMSPHAPVPAAAPAPPQPQPPPRTIVSVSLRNGNMLGSDTAPVTLVEFTDYQCRFCRRFAEDTFPRIKQNFIDTGKVRFVSRNLPLSLHPFAWKAAQAVMCASEQGKFWELRAVLFAHGTALTNDDLQKYANNLGLDMEKFTAGFTTDKFQQAIAADQADANTAGISGTPSFVLGRSAGKETLTGAKIVGAQPYAVFEAEINKQLAAGPGGNCQ